MNKKSIYFILLIIFLGCILGTALSMFIAYILPDGVVKDFFLLSKTFGFGVSEKGWLELGPLRLRLGFFFDISVLSIIGVFVSWYILRYFK